MAVVCHNFLSKDSHPDLNSGCPTPVGISSLGSPYPQSSSCIQKSWHVRVLYLGDCHAEPIESWCDRDGLYSPFDQFRVAAATSYGGAEIMLSRKDKKNVTGS